MRAAEEDAPRLIHAVPGRARIHLPADWVQSRDLESSLVQLTGVQSVQANGLTANILVRFDARVTSDQHILAALRQMYTPGAGSGVASAFEQPAMPLTNAGSPRRLAVQQERREHTVRARIAVPGMDRSPHLARHVADHLASNHPGVRSKVSMLTGRVLVEFNEHEDDLDDLCAELTGMDLPDMLDEDQPTDPLDPGPLVQSATRTAGATIGLTLVASRRLVGTEHPLDTAGPVQATAVVGILSGLPFVRDRLRKLFGRDSADILLSVPAIIGLALSDSPLGLLLSAAEGLRLLTEVVTRRAAWRRFETRLLDLPAPVPGTIIRVESGERAPLAATVVEGVGTATGADGLPTNVVPGATISAGARLFGGSFVLELAAPEPFTPAPRPAPVAPTVYERYTLLAIPASLGYAAVSGVFSRSFTRALEGLLLVSPRTAVIGMEAAEIGASARVLRAGVTNVGTRRHRTVRFPHVLLLDGPRVLTDGFEVADVLPLDETWNAAGVLDYASAISTVSGSPWGAAFRALGDPTATDGAFDGETATATVAGAPHTLSPVTDWASAPVALRDQHQGSYVLQLRVPGAAQPLGYLALRPRLAPGATDLVETCRRRGIAIALISGTDSPAAQTVAQRVAIPLVSDTDPPAAIRSLQAQGQYVALVADHAHAAASFDAADLAIGIADPQSHLPARADLIAADLTAVAAIVEAGVRSETGVRGSVALSLVANGAGAIWGLSGQVGLELASEAIYLTSLAALVWDWLVLRGGNRPQAQRSEEAAVPGGTVTQRDVEGTTTPLSALPAPRHSLP